jgi:hypothetical protein
MSEVATQRLSQAESLKALAASGARRLGGVAVGAGLGTVLWLVIMQDGFQRGFFGRTWSGQDFASAMGDLFGGQSGNIKQRGFYATLVVAGVVVALFGVVLHVLRSRLPERWTLQALGLAGAVFLIWGLGYSPLIKSRGPEAGGVFGIDAGSTTWLVAVLASLAFSIIAVRIYRLMADEDWWSPGRRKIEAAATLEAMGVGEAREDVLTSLELAEEGREQP